MADVDTTPQQPETLEAVESEVTQEESEVSPLEPSQEVPEQKRDSPEGRLSPEGAQEAPAESQPVEKAATENVGDTQTGPQPEAEQGGTTDEPQNQPQAGDGDKENPKESGASGETGDQEAGALAEGRAGDGGDDKEEKEGDKGEDNEDAAPTADGDKPPATPTFSTDNEHEEDVDDTIRAQAQEALEAEARAEAAELADKTPALEVSQTPAGELPVPIKRLTNTPLEGAVMPLKPPTAQLPPVARGQVRGQQMTSAITDALRHNTLPSPKQIIRSRRPPKYIRLATVTVSPARTRQLPHGPSLYYEEPRRPKKVITWDEAINARPPLRVDMEGPTPCTYTPGIKPLSETNAPSFTFGSKCQPEKTGGARTSWAKSWFQTPHVWHSKADFIRDSLWPSPSHYPKGSSLGPRQRTMPEAPSYTFGHKTAYSIVKPGAPKEPSPNEYKRQMADRIVLPQGPSFTHQLRREGTMLWGSTEITPGPAAYRPNKPSRERPSFTIQGVRREKSHILGPYSSL